MECCFLSQTWISLSRLDYYRKAQSLCTHYISLLDTIIQTLWSTPAPSARGFTTVAIFCARSGICHLAFALVAILNLLEKSWSHSKVTKRWFRLRSEIQQQRQQQRQQRQQWQQLHSDFFLFFRKEPKIRLKFTKCRIWFISGGEEPKIERFWRCRLSQM